MAVDAILEKKGRNIEVLDVRGVSGVADFFVVVSGDSELQVKAIVAAVRGNVRDETGELPWHVEGTDHFNWVLLDYVDLVVHVFLPEQREYYGLERLWGDAPHETVDEAGSASDVKILKD